MRTATSVCIAAVALITAVGFAVPSDAALTGSTCTGGKLKAAGKKAQAKLSCHRRAAGKGLTTDTDCLNKAVTKFNNSFAKAEGKPPCFATGDAGAIEIKVDTFVSNMVAVLRPVQTESKCTAGELGAAGKKAAGKLNCHVKAAKKGLVVDPACLTKAEDTFDRQYAAAVGKGDCLSGTTAASVEADVDVFVADIAATLRPGPLSPCTGVKMREAGAKVDAKLTCHGKATGDGLAVDSACLTNAEDNFDAGFLVAESLGPCLQPNGDAAAIETVVDAFVGNIVAALRPTMTPASKCSEKKLVVTGNEVHQKLNCRGNSIRFGLPASAKCLDGADVAQGFINAEKPADCLAPTGDAAAIEGMIDPFLDDVRDDLVGTTTTTSTTTTTL